MKKHLLLCAAAILILSTNFVFADEEQRPESYGKDACYNKRTIGGFCVKKHGEDESAVVLSVDISNEYFEDLWVADNALIMSTTVYIAFGFARVTNCQYAEKLFSVTEKEPEVICTGIEAERLNQLKAEEHPSIKIIFREVEGQDLECVDLQGSDKEVAPQVCFIGQVF